VPTLLKAATSSSIHSETSGTSQLIQNDPKQVKDTNEGFNRKLRNYRVIVDYGFLHHLVDIVWECVIHAFFIAKEFDY